MSTHFFKYPTSLLRDSKPHATFDDIHGVNSRNLGKLLLVTNRRLDNGYYK